MGERPAGDGHGGQRARGFLRSFGVLDWIPCISSQIGGQHAPTVKRAPTTLPKSQNIRAEPTMTDDPNT